MPRAMVALAFAFVLAAFGKSLAAEEVFEQRSHTDPASGLVTVEFGHSTWLGFGWITVFRCHFDSKLAVDIKNNVDISAEVTDKVNGSVKIGEEITNPKLINQVSEKLRDLDFTLGKVCLAFSDNQITTSEYLKLSGAIVHAMGSLNVEAGARKIVVMDSFLKPYRPETAALGQTNADDIALWLPIDAQVFLERTNASWNRQQFVRDLKPDLLIIHFSAFETKDFACNVWAKDKSKDAVCNEIFFSLVADLLRKGTKVIVFTRTSGVCDKPDDDFSFVQKFKSQLAVGDEFLPQVTLMDMSGKNPPQNFYDGDGARRLKMVVDAVLGGKAVPVDPGGKRVCGLI